MPGRIEDPAEGPRTQEADRLFVLLSARKRRLRSFSRRYGGPHRPLDAVWWLGHPLERAPSGAEAPRATLESQRRQMFRQEVSAQEQQSYQTDIRRIETEDRLAWEALDAWQGRRRAVRSRALWIAGAAGAGGVALLAAVSLTPSPRTQNPAGTAVAAAVTMSAPNLGLDARSELMQVERALPSLRTADADTTAGWLRRLRFASGEGFRNPVATSVSGVVTAGAPIDLGPIGVLAQGRAVRITVFAETDVHYRWQVELKKPATGAERGVLISANSTEQEGLSTGEFGVPWRTTARKLVLHAPRSAVALYEFDVLG